MTDDTVTASLIADPASATTAAVLARSGQVFTPEQFGAVGNGVTDDAPAIQAAFNAAQVAGGGTVLLRGRAYGVRSTVTTGDSYVTLRGSGGRRRSELRGLAAVTMLLVASNTVVEDVYVNGNNVALWGVKSTQQAHKLSLVRVRVENCVDAGFVLESAQNGILFDCTAQLCRVLYAFYNGVANFKVVNCNGSNTLSGTNPGERGLLVANVTNAQDPRLVGTVLAGGNRNISMIGGIYERTVGDYQAEIVHATGQVTFTDVELIAGTVAAVSVATTVPASSSIQFTNTAFALGATSTVAVNAAGGRVVHRGSVYTGTSNRHELEMNTASGTASIAYTLTTSTRRANVLSEAASFMQTPAAVAPGGWAAFGTGGTVTYDATKRRVVVGAGGNAIGARVFYDGTLANYTNAYRQMRVTICVRNVTGATPRLNAALEAAPFRRTIGTLANGENTFLVEMTGDETGIEVVCDTAAATSLEVCYLTVEII